jgi:hypothetical protein
MMALGLENSKPRLSACQWEVTVAKKKKKNYKEQYLSVCIRDNILREHVDFLITYLEMRE